MSATKGFGLFVKGFSTIASHSKNNYINHGNFLQSRPAMNVGLSRLLSTHRIADNIKYMTNDDSLSVKVDPETMKLTNPNGNPLCVMLCWLGSNQKNIMKYASTYMDQGYDVMTVRISMLQSMFVEPEVKITASNLLKFLEQNLHTFDPPVLQGFSIGCLMWSQVLEIVEKDLERYVPVVNQFKVQVWDSMVSPVGMQYGIAKAVFPNNDFLKNLASKYLTWHMNKFYEISAKHYITGKTLLLKNRCHSPMLHFCSVVDQVGTFEANTEYKDAWTAIGIPITQKVFEASPHVQHYHYYPKEYLQEFYSFFAKHDLLFKPELLMKKIESSELKRPKNVVIA